jgi:hypothetical protein
LIVTAAVPLEVTVTDFVTEVPTETLPNGNDVALRVSAGVTAFNCSETACEELPDVAVKVADCAPLTDATLAVNAALVADADTVTEAGTVTMLLLLARLTLRPPVGAEPERLTVHESAIDPVIEVLLHDTAVTVGVMVAPVPLKLIVVAGALLEIVNCSDSELAVVGLN